MVRYQFSRVRFDGIERRHSYNPIQSTVDSKLGIGDAHSVNMIDRTAPIAGGWIFGSGNADSLMGALEVIGDDANYRINIALIVALNTDLMQMVRALFLTSPPIGSVLGRVRPAIFLRRSIGQRGRGSTSHWATLVDTARLSHYGCISFSSFTEPFKCRMRH